MSKTAKLYSFIFGVWLYLMVLCKVIFKVCPWNHELASSRKTPILQNFSSKLLVQNCKAEALYSLHETLSRGPFLTFVQIMFSGSQFAPLMGSPVFKTGNL